MRILIVEDEKRLADTLAELLHRRGYAVDVGAIRVQMEAEGLAAELYEISADKLQKYLLVICLLYTSDAADE